MDRRTKQRDPEPAHRRETPPRPAIRREDREPPRVELLDVEERTPEEAGYGYGV